MGILSKSGDLLFQIEFPESDRLSVIGIGDIQLCAAANNAGIRIFARDILKHGAFCPGLPVVCGYLKGERRPRPPVFRYGIGTEYQRPVRTFGGVNPAVVIGERRLVRVGPRLSIIPGVRAVYRSFRAAQEHMHRSRFRFPERRLQRWRGSGSLRPAHGRKK